MVKRVIVPTDGSDHATKALDFTSDLALKYGAMVYLIHLLSQLLQFPEQEALQRMRESHRQFGQKLLEGAEKRVRNSGVKNVHSAILEGDPATQILEFSGKNGIDMIVMGSHGAGGLERLLLGSVSHRVCHLADCTCVTVK